MDWYYTERPIRTIEDSFKDLESIFKDKNTNDTPRIPVTGDIYRPLTDVNFNPNGITSRENSHYIATTPTSSLSFGSRSFQDSIEVRSPPQGSEYGLGPVLPNRTTSPLLQPPTSVQFQMQVPRSPSTVTTVSRPLPINNGAAHNNNAGCKSPQKKSLAIIPPWIHVPNHSRFFVIKSSSLEHVKKSFYNGIWSSTFYGNKRLSEAYESLPEGAKIYLLFSVNASGRFCGVAEMNSNLRDDLDTSIWKDNNSRYRHAFKVRWIVVRDVHNRSLKQFLIPANDMKPVTNSRDTQEIPATICKSILKLFKYEQGEVQSFLDDDYS